MLLYQQVSRNWQPAPVQAYPDSIPGGTASGVTTKSHDRDSSAAFSDSSFVPNEAGASQVIVKETATGATRVISTFNLSNPPYYQGPSYCAGTDAGGQCLGYYGTYDNVHYQFLQIFYSPRGDNILVVINHVSPVNYPQDWYACSQPLGSGTATQCRGFNSDYSSDSAVVFSISITSGQVIPQRLGAIGGRSIFWLGVSESDDAIVLGSGHRIFRSISAWIGGGLFYIVNTCQVEFRSRDFTTALQTPVSSPDGCHMLSYAQNDHAGGGSIASTARPPVPGSIVRYLPPEAEIRKAWGAR